jgi:c(7)-type cytochrome triheme protein
MKKILFLAAGLLAAIHTSAYAEGGGNVTFNPAGADPVVFNHDYHLKTRGIKCSACHFSTFTRGSNGYQIKKEKLNKRDFCQHCHNGLKSFDVSSDKNCTRCHKK